MALIQLIYSGGFLKLILAWQKQQVITIVESNYTKFWVGTCWTKLKTLSTVYLIIHIFSIHCIQFKIHLSSDSFKFEKVKETFPQQKAI